MSSCQKWSHKKKRKWLQLKNFQENRIPTASNNADLYRWLEFLKISHLCNEKVFLSCFVLECTVVELSVKRCFFKLRCCWLMSLTVFYCQRLFCAYCKPNLLWIQDVFFLEIAWMLWEKLKKHIRWEARQVSSPKVCALHALVRSGNVPHEPVCVCVCVCLCVCVCVCVCVQPVFLDIPPSKSTKVSISGNTARATATDDKTTKQKKKKKTATRQTCRSTWRRCYNCSL